MWLLINPESKERICRIRFASKKGLAKFLGISTQKLNAESVFQWNGKPAQVAMQKQYMFAITNAEGKLCGRAVTKSEIAKIIGVSPQTVHSAFTRPICPVTNGIRIKGFVVNFFFEKGPIIPC